MGAYCGGFYVALSIKHFEFAIALLKKGINLIENRLIICFENHIIFFQHNIFLKPFHNVFFINSNTATLTGANNVFIQETLHLLKYY